MFLNCIFPENWTKGIIVPVPIKGDPNDTNNYRGITLTSIFSKIFSHLLDNRLRKNEDCGCLGILYLLNVFYYHINRYVLRELKYNYKVI